ncbi:MAG: hypothetical protein KH380_01000 [Coprobacillus sp.]|nr:hypothetical protein [Coprobacillus sp.]
MLSEHQIPAFKKAKPIYPHILEKEMNVSLFFVQEVNIQKEGYLQITGNNLYRIFDNGQLMGYGPARAAHDYYRVDQYMLKEGKHRIVIEHVYYHCNNFCSTNTAPFLECEVIEDERVLAYTGNKDEFICYKNESRYQKVVRLSYQRAFSESYHFAFDLMDFYTGKKNPFSYVLADVLDEKELLSRIVDYPKFEGIAFEKMEEGTFTYDESIKPYDDRYMHLEKLKIFPMESWEVDPNAYISRLVYQEEKVGSLKANVFYTYRLPSSKTGFISWEIEALEDSEFYFLFDELDSSKGEKKPIEILFYRNTTHNIISYECKKGKHHHITIEPYTMQFLRLVVKKGNIRIHQLSFIPYENPLVSAVTYQFSNYKIQKVANAAIDTFRQNAVDILTDCPSRERAGWLCDSYFTGKSESLISKENKVEHNFLENYALLEQYPYLPKGMVPMCYPGDHPDGTFIPNWSLWYILELKDYLLRTHDEDLVKQSLAKIKGLLHYFEKFENELGFLENLENWVFVEWSKANDNDFICGVNFPSNMLYMGALEAASELLHEPSLKMKAKHIKEMIEKFSFNGEFYVDNMIRNEKNEFVITDHTTETCQYYAFYFHLATPKNHEELFNKMRLEFGPKRDHEKVYPQVYKSNVFIGDYLRLMILLEYGYVEEVLDETVDYFYNMAIITGTLWEHDSTFASLNHGLTSSIFNIICGACFGLIRIDHSNKKIFLNKRFAKEKATLHIPTDDGDISISNEEEKVEIKKPSTYECIYLDSVQL